MTIRNTKESVMRFRKVSLLAATSVIAILFNGSAANAQVSVAAEASPKTNPTLPPEVDTSGKVTTGQNKEDGGAIVVTGSTGIAAASARRFAIEGARVFVISKTAAHAAELATAQGLGPAYNVSDGFEGPHDEHGHRSVAGWKADGLPWRQG